jgi:hypothetical protein
MVGTGWVNGHMVYYYYGLDCTNMSNGTLYGMTFAAPVQTGCSSNQCFQQYYGTSPAPAVPRAGLQMPVDCDEQNDASCRHRFDPTLLASGWAGASSASAPEFDFLKRIVTCKQVTLYIPASDGQTLITVSACLLKPTDPSVLNFPAHGVGLEWKASPAASTNVDPGSGPKHNGGSYYYLAKYQHDTYHILTGTKVQ